MPSDERRLHPLSILFGLVAQVREFVLPGLVVLFTAGSAGYPWEAWLPFLLVPYVFVLVVRYVSFRYRFDDNELVLRSGLVFRNERHVPYGRVQNLDAVQGVLHRLMGVVEVRLETGGGDEPEARLSVVSTADFEHMRARVFAGRGALAPVASSATGEAPPLLRLGWRDLVLHGLIENRGLVVLAAGFGLLWELGLMDRFSSAVLGEREISSRGLARGLAAALLGRGALPLDRIGLALGAFAALLVLVRLLSAAWALVKLHGYVLTRVGGDLRTRFGLATRVIATIPMRRIQTLTVREGPLHRLFRRASVRVDTAGGGGEQGQDAVTQRAWLAPLVHAEALPPLLRAVLPELDLAAVQWRPVAPRAYARELRQSLVVALLLTLPFVLMLRFWSLALFGVLALAAWPASRAHVSSLGWALVDGAVLFKSGWLWRQMTVARFAKIQAVGLSESPFDRRADMAGVSVDTAGAGDLSHRVSIPYLARATAEELRTLLAHQAARTAFRW